MVSWSRIIEYFPKIIVKFPVTLKIVLVSFVCGIILGGILALIRIKKIPVLNQITAVLVSYIRCTPAITQMFVVYFGISVLLTSMGIKTSGIDRIVYVYIAYSINMSGFLAEIFRSSIQAVPFGQTEAGKSIGLTGFQTMVHIVLPQAVRIAMPMLGTTFIMLFKATALAYMIGVVDMIGKVTSIAAVSGHSLEGYICCAVVFAVISLVLEQIFNRIDKHLDFGNSGRLNGRKVKRA